MSCCFDLSACGTHRQTPKAYGAQGTKQAELEVSFDEYNANKKCLVDLTSTSSPPTETVLWGQINKKRENSILIEMKDTSVSYGGVNILQGINWRMREGENWAIIGPNGAGKSTLFLLVLHNFRNWLCLSV